MELFFTTDIQGTTAFFEADEARHIAKALRKRIGDPICFTNGQGIRFEGVLSKESRGCIEVEIIDSSKKEKNWRGHLAIALAPTKNFGRIEWAIERMTEMGIDEIIPLETDHSERKAWKTNRISRVCIAALKQSQQYHLPKIHPPIRFDQWLHQLNPEVCYYIGHCADGKKTPLKDIQLETKNVCFCIGPEGDFSSDEIAAGLKNGMIAISLGSNRLRTETAAMKVTTFFSVQNDL